MPFYPIIPIAAPSLQRTSQLPQNEGAIVPGVLAPRATGIKRHIPSPSRLFLCRLYLIASFICQKSFHNSLVDYYIYKESGADLPADSFSRSIYELHI